jgi:hypothetical protein
LHAHDIRNASIDNKQSLGCESLLILAVLTLWTFQFWMCEVLRICRKCPPFVSWQRHFSAQLDICLVATAMASFSPRFTNIPGSINSICKIKDVLLRPRWESHNPFGRRLGFRNMKTRRDLLIVFSVAWPQLPELCMAQPSIAGTFNEFNSHGCFGLTQMQS